MGRRGGRGGWRDVGEGHILTYMKKPHVTAQYTVERPNENFLKHALCYSWSTQPDPFSVTASRGRGGGRGGDFSMQTLPVRELHQPHNHTFSHTACLGDSCSVPSEEGLPREGPGKASLFQETMAHGSCILLPG